MKHAILLVLVSYVGLNACASTAGKHYHDPIRHSASPQFLWSGVESLHSGCYVAGPDLDTFAFYPAITFRLTTPGRVVIELLCRDSSLVGVLFDSTLTTMGWNGVNWYGDDLGGTRGTGGTFYCRIILPDSVSIIDLGRVTYPNPFSSGSIIWFDVSHGGLDSVIVYDLNGVSVRHLLDSTCSTIGKYSVYWDGLDDSSKAVNSGVYFYRLYSADTVLATKKTVVVR